MLDRNTWNHLTERNNLIISKQTYFKSHGPKFYKFMHKFSVDQDGKISRGRGLIKKKKNPKNCVFILSIKQN